MKENQNLFDDDNLIYMLLPEERATSIPTMKPYILFKRDNEFVIEILPAMLKRHFKDYYGKNYEIIYDANKTSEYTLRESGISFVKTTVGEVKGYLNDLENEDNKIFTRCQKR